MWSFMYQNGQIVWLLAEQRCCGVHGIEGLCRAGTGKSTYMRRHLAELPASEWATINITLSARTPAGALQDQVLAHCLTFFLFQALAPKEEPA